MYKIILMFFAVITLIACSKKNTISNNGFIDIYPQIAGKWKAIKYEQKTTTRLGPPYQDSLIMITNINNKGIPFIDLDSLDMIDFIDRDTIGFKEGNYNYWYNRSTNRSYDFYYIDWYRHQFLYLNGTTATYEIKLNNNSLQIGFNNTPYYRWTYFERAK